MPKVERYKGELRVGDEIEIIESMSNPKVLCRGTIESYDGHEYKINVTEKLAGYYYSSTVWATPREDGSWRGNGWHEFVRPYAIDNWRERIERQALTE